MIGRGSRQILIEGGALPLDSVRRTDWTVAITVHSKNKIVFDQKLALQLAQSSTAVFNLRGPH